jgi:hypothetical protein
MVGRARPLRQNPGRTDARPCQDATTRLAEASIHVPLLRTAALALVVALPSGASHGADFTFKRVRPPAPDATRRIDIQIEPPAAPAPAPEVAVPVPDETPGAQDWFWSEVPDGIGRIPGRFAAAAHLAKEPPAASGIAAPSLRMLQGIARLHGPDILRRSVGTRLSPALILALISVESGGRPAAVSPKGATGLMQLIPATAARFGVADAADPAENIAGGVAYLDWLMNEFDGDPVLALAGYNAGEGAVRRHGGVPPYAETRAYVPKVLAAWNVARLMCRTPPVQPGDGCVFDASLMEG